jgi:hypothetical protein
MCRYRATLAGGTAVPPGAPMTSRPARILSIVIGVLAVLLGLLWIGQGSGLLAGSAMTGNPMWLWIGLVVAVIGIVLLVLGIRRRRSVPRA